MMMERLHHPYATMPGESSGEYSAAYSVSYIIYRFLNIFINYVQEYSSAFCSTLLVIVFEGRKAKMTNKVLFKKEKNWKRFVQLPILTFLWEKRSTLVTVECDCIPPHECVFPLYNKWQLNMSLFFLPFLYTNSFKTIWKLANVLVVLPFLLDHE